MKNACVCVASLLLLGTPSGTLLAWNPFERKSSFHEVALRDAELASIAVSAGWSAQAGETLLLELHNKLPGPVLCAGATVRLLSGKVMNKSFSPKLYVPAMAARQGGLAGVAKGQMKDYSIQCACWKRSDTGPCENPLAPSSP